MTSLQSAIITSCLITYRAFIHTYKPLLPSATFTRTSPSYVIIAYMDVSHILNQKLSDYMANKFIQVFTICWLRPILTLSLSRWWIPWKLLSHNMWRPCASSDPRVLERIMYTTLCSCSMSISIHSLTERESYKFIRLLSCSKFCTNILNW